MPPVTESFEKSFKIQAVQEPQSRGSATRLGGSEPLAQPEPPFCPFPLPSPNVLFLPLKFLILNKTVTLPPPQNS